MNIEKEVERYMENISDDETLCIAREGLDLFVADGSLSQSDADRMMDNIYEDESLGWIRDGITNVLEARAKAEKTDTTPYKDESSMELPIPDDSRPTLFETYICPKCGGHFLVEAEAEEFLTKFRCPYGCPRLRYRVSLSRALSGENQIWTFNSKEDAIEKYNEIEKGIYDPLLKKHGREYLDEMNIEGEITWASHTDGIPGRFYLSFRVSENLTQTVLRDDAGHFDLYVEAVEE